MIRGADGSFPQERFCCGLTAMTGLTARLLVVLTSAA